MSLSGSGPLRRFSSWFAGRTVSGVAPDGRRLTARGVARDFSLWEKEISDCVADVVATTKTVIGTRVVELPLGQRPIQEVLRHLRRLRSAIDALPPDVSFVRWEGLIRAYDDHLFAACHDLGVPTDLLTIGFGRARDDERGRLERVLCNAGLPVR